MHFQVLATDYDGTIAHDSRVDEATLQSLRLLKKSGRKLVLVSGRQLESLQGDFAHLDLFDLAVLENGALLFDPATGEESTLVAPPPPEYVARLRERGLSNLALGRAIIAGRVPDHEIMFETIRELNLELQVIFNKADVMVLPTGVNKATGLRVALDQLGCSAWNTVGVGDAENDESLFEFCGLSVAVANALPAVKEMADLVMDHERGAGVMQLIERMLATDLQNHR